MVGRLGRPPEDDACGNGRPEQHGKPGKIGKLGFVAGKPQFHGTVFLSHEHKTSDHQHENSQQIEPAPLGGGPAENCVDDLGHVFGKNNGPENKKDGDRGGNPKHKRIKRFC